MKKIFFSLSLFIISGIHPRSSAARMNASPGDKRSRAEEVTSRRESSDFRTPYCVRKPRKPSLRASVIFIIMLPFMVSADLIVSADTVIPLAPSTGTFTYDLYRGMVNSPDVAHLQEFLRDREFYNGPINGNFFSQTQQALITFQGKEGIVPASGYFGLKTRSRINVYIGGTAIPSREEQIALLQHQIKILQAQLVHLIAQERTVASPTPTPTPSLIIMPISSPSPSQTPPPPVATTTPVIPVAELRISGDYTQPFPPVSTSPLKLGDIVISNTTNRVFLFNQITLDIYDAMNSTLNRNKTVLFKLRDGTTTFDNLISQTKFDINREPPGVGEENRRQVRVSFPRIIQPGQTYISSLWIENLDYVISGSLRVQVFDVLVSDAPAPKGNFTFILTTPLQ